MINFDYASYMEAGTIMPVDINPISQTRRFFSDMAQNANDPYEFAEKDHTVLMILGGSALTSGVIGTVAALCLQSYSHLTYSLATIGIGAITIGQASLSSPHRLFP